MDYLEATSIAKANPGSTLTRDDSGLFVVRLQDGRVIASPRDFKEEIQNAHASPSGQLDEGFVANPPEDQDWNQKIIAGLRGRLYNKDAEISSLTRQLAEQKNLIAQITQENTALNLKLSKVSEQELARIKEADLLARKADFEHRKSIRHVVKCSCLGQVENCFKCGGSGEYEIDGSGHQV